MRRTWLRSLALIAALGASVVSPAAHAEAPVTACSSAYARGQQERLAGRLFTARAAFITCSASACPAPMAADCSSWQAEVEADLPTVRLSVTDDHGRLIEGLRVFADGDSVSPTQLTAPLILEAGPHDLRFEAPGYRAAHVEKALRPSDREVEVSVILRPPEERVAAGPERNPHSGGVPTTSVVFASAGALALGGALYFGLAAHAQYQELKHDCAPLCSQADSDSLYTKAVISDVALVSAVAAFSASAWFYFTRPTARPSAALHMQSRPGGAQVSLATSF